MGNLYTYALHVCVFKHFEFNEQIRATEVYVQCEALGIYCSMGRSVKTVGENVDDDILTTEDFPRKRGKNGKLFFYNVFQPTR
jgi:hypothetical protein